VPILKRFLLCIIFLLLIGCGTTTHSGAKLPCSAWDAKSWPISNHDLLAISDIGQIGELLANANVSKEEAASVESKLKAAFAPGDQLWSYTHREGINETKGYVLLRECHIVVLVETEKWLVND
jgi:hypothetical protein